MTYAAPSPVPEPKVVAEVLETQELKPADGSTLIPVPKVVAEALETQELKPADDSTPIAVPKVVAEARETHELAPADGNPALVLELKVVTETKKAHKLESVGYQERIQKEVANV